MTIGSFEFEQQPSTADQTDAPCLSGISGGQHMIREQSAHLVCSTDTNNGLVFSLQQLLEINKLRTEGDRLEKWQSACHHRQRGDI